MKLAEQFRRLLAQGLKSGKYEPWHTRGNELIHKVKSLDEFMDYLDAICDQFDPAKPPRQPGSKSSVPPAWPVESYSLGVALLELLLDRGIEIANHEQTIATLIGEFTDIAMGKKPAAGRGERLVVYAARFNLIAEVPR